MTANAVTRGYLIEMEEDEDGTFTVLVPDLPGCVAAATSPGRAIKLIGQAIDGWISDARAQGDAVPEPTARELAFSGKLLVRMAKSVHRAAAKRAQAEGISLNQWCVTAL